MSRHSCVDVLSRARHRHSLFHFCTLAMAVLLLAPAGAYAQSIVDPTTAEFDPSADHNVTVSGVPVVDHYEIGFYLIAAAQPFQVNQLGKPSPAADGKIRVALGPRPAPGTLYEARVSAVGPGGAGLSAVSNNFTFTVPVPCSYTVSPTTPAMAAGGGAANVAVTTTSGCAWTATESLSWVTITSGGSGTGNGTVNYTVDGEHVDIVADGHADGGRPGGDHHAEWRGVQLHGAGHDAGDGGRRRCGERRGRRRPAAARGPRPKASAGSRSRVGPAAPGTAPSITR